MYEKTIGRYNLIYYIAAPPNLTRVVDLLDPPDRDELYGYINNPKFQLIVVDGYMRCDGVMTVAHKVDGAEEIVDVGERYPLPIHQWQEQVWVRGVGQILVRFVTS